MSAARLVPWWQPSGRADDAPLHGTRSDRRTTFDTRRVASLALRYHSLFAVTSMYSNSVKSTIRSFLDNRTRLVCIISGRSCHERQLLIESNERLVGHVQIDSHRPVALLKDKSKKIHRSKTVRLMDFR